MAPTPYVAWPASVSSSEQGSSVLLGSKESSYKEFISHIFVTYYVLDVLFSVTRLFKKKREKKDMHFSGFQRHRQGPALLQQASRFLLLLRFSSKSQCLIYFSRTLPFPL